jgi:NCS1 family nucleobase:cation symporter-1
MTTTDETGTRATAPVVAPLIERRTIDRVPEAERHGRPAQQFTLWFGANMQITAIVTGALAVLLGAGGATAVLGLLMGNVIGGASMALHSAQGPRTGLPQMISSRVQFGVKGAALPLVLVILMYLGFASTGAVLAGQAVDVLLGIDVPLVGITVFGLLTIVVAVSGYRLIHTIGRIATVAGVLGIGYLALRLFATEDVVGAFSRGGAGGAVAFLTAVTLGAGWQMTYAPYVADYSRYLPSATRRGATFWWTFSGSVLGTQIAMTFGVLVALVGGSAFLDDQVGYLATLAGPGLPAFLVALVIIVGKLTVNCLNAYGGFMSILTAVTGFDNRKAISARTRALCIIGFVLVSLVIATLASGDFLAFFSSFVLLLLAVFIPWSIINLIDYYLISREHVDIPALYDPRGRYGAVGLPAIVSYLVGIAVQIPFLSQTLYTGPVAQALDGADISWLVSLVVTPLLYYPWAKRVMRVPERMILPEEAQG